MNKIYTKFFHYQGKYSKERQTADCRYSLPDGFYFTPDVFCSTSFTSQIAKTASEVTKSSGVGASVSAEAGGGFGGISASAGFSASSQYKKMKNRMQEEEKISIVSKASCGYYFGYQDPVSPPELDESFLAFVEENLWKGKEEYEDEKFLDFFGHFGTHFIVEIGIFSFLSMYLFPLKLKLTVLFFRLWCFVHIPARNGKVLV